MKKTEGDYLEDAYTLAQKSMSLNEVPVGAIVINAEGLIIGEGWNKKEQTNDITTHAEIEAIRDAIKTTKNWRLTDATLYTTLEPCPMCAGAILQARLKKVVFGAKDHKWGAGGSIVNLLTDNQFNHQVELIYHPHEKSSDILTQFFKALRQKHVD